MTTRQKEKVLITLDGSKRSLQTAVYASRLRSLQQMEIKLFHVFDCIPANYWDLDIKKQVVGEIAGLRSWEAQRKKSIENYMTRAKKVLIGAGFSEQNLQIEITNRKKGIARDIIQEARDGYKMIITRRRGMGAIRSLIVGSTTAKLLDTLHTMPILLAGQYPPGNKFLIAVDGSENSERMLDFAANLLDNYGCQMGLVHVVRSGADRFAGDMPMSIYSPESFMKEALEQSQTILENARNRLIERGVQERYITCRTITGFASRSSAIIDVAKKGDYGTIVLGRKGLSSVGEFSMGRVTKKIIYMARKHSVWIIQ